MAIPISISQPVGTRNGVMPMPNSDDDLAKVTDLFDRIPVAQGGSMEIGGVWASDRIPLIAEVTGQIITFQTRHKRPVIDGVIDPGGGTLKLMNSLARDRPGPGPLPADGIRATLAPAPGSLPEKVKSGMYVVDPGSVMGRGQLRYITAGYDYVRKLVRVEGSSIKWFGVVWRQDLQPPFIPHINFTPTPIQGGYQDGSYDSFGGWDNLWRDYTDIIGGQMCGAGVDQVLVIPFYKTSQQRDLGAFLDNWREVVSAVVTAVLEEVAPAAYRERYQFSRIVTSSFSNGWVAHQQFNGQGQEVKAMSDKVFDLDGQAGGSHWRPENGVVFLNQTPPMGINPVGSLWYVGGRWNAFTKLYPTGMNTHANCRNHLLYPGLWMHCRTQDIPVL